jgi:hypothetical protein
LVDYFLKIFVSMVFSHQAILKSTNRLIFALFAKKNNCFLCVGSLKKMLKRKTQVKAEPGIQPIVSDERPVKFPKLNHSLFCANNCQLDLTMAGSPRVFAFMAANPGLKPCTVPISLEGKMFMWKCGECAHRFKMTCGSVHRGCWCPFCTQDSLCGSEACLACFNKSCASHYRAISLLAANRSINLLTVPLSATTTFQWLCFECDQVFMAPCSDVMTGGDWCPSCKK